ncbi:MAG: peptidoglycan-binding protein [Ignavibacteria bacterium]|jgi:hypothetical protein
MSRILFQKSARGFRTVRGGIISDIQKTLTGKGFDTKGVDGIYGTNSYKAVSEFQSQNGLDVNGAIDLDTWDKLMQQDIPTIQQRALQLTAAFEGHGFSKVVGNFDGAGITWGIIGFTLKFGGIKDIIISVNQSDPGILDTCFGNLKNELLNVLEKPVSQQIEWGDSISMGSGKYSVMDNWEDAFEELGNSKAAQEAQFKKVQHYFDRGQKDFEKFNLKSEMGYALCFDIAVQNGGVSKQETGEINHELTDNPPADEQDVREVIANVVAVNSNPRWVEDVRSRKLTIADGKGSVHGAQYNVKSWGIGEFDV